MKNFIKQYYRKKHGRADHGGEVASHNREMSSSHIRLVNQLADKVWELRRQGKSDSEVREAILQEINDGLWLAKPTKVKATLEYVLGGGIDG